VDLPGNAAPVIISMTTDKEGNLWLLDAYRGLYRTNRRFESYPVGLENIQAILLDHAGNFFVGHASGLFLLHDFTQRPEEILGDINVMSLYEDRQRNLWVGTFGQGLYCRPHGTTQWHRYKKENGLTDESILSITGLKDTLWLATLGGVTRIQVEQPMSQFRLNSTNYNLADGLGTNFIYTAFVDSQGRIWFGTDGNGLSVLKGTSIQNFQVLDTIQLHSVYSITEDPEGMIWFVTDRDGVFRYDGSAFVLKSLPTTLQDHEVSNIVADPYGNLLLAHTSGVDILTNDGHVINFRGTASELLYPNLNAHFVDSTDAIWIAGQHTILKYNPFAHAVRNAPLSILTDVQVFLSSVDFSTHHIFKAAQNYITFNFIGLWYTDPRNVTYRYKLEGLDPGWNETREHSMTYQNLSPGTYRFELESSSSGQFGSGHTVSYAFEIRKPFYQTALFIVLATTLFFLGIYAALRIREQRINKAAALQRRQIESQLQTLKAQINPHFLFNSFNTLVSVIEEDPRSAVEYVENLSDFYRSILQYREKNLIPLQEEIEIVKTYSYVLHKRYGSALRIEIAPAWGDIWIVPLVLQILMENAVKHNIISERKPLTISIRQHDAGTLIIENTLQKRSVISDSTGFGLQSIISRYALLTRRPVQVGQADHKFYVIIPLLNNDEISDHRR
jgi:streptogramin lyase